MTWVDPVLHTGYDGLMTLFFYLSVWSWNGKSTRDKKIASLPIFGAIGGIYFQQGWICFSTMGPIVNRVQEYPWQQILHLQLEYYLF